MSGSGNAVGEGAALVISGVHDYRGARRVSVHAIAAGLARRGYETSFLSVRFSPLSLLKRDLRAGFWDKANRPETRDGITCYLWRTPFHPFATGAAFADHVTAPLLDVYASWPSGDVGAMMRKADVIVIESGLPIALIPRARRANPGAKIIYLGADALDAIGAHPALQRLLQHKCAAVDHFCILAKGLAPQFAWARDRTFHIPQGIDSSVFATIGESPYRAAVNAVSVGSMLFDKSFFEVAGKQFPNVCFHVIGSESDLKEGDNLRVYPEMPFQQTLPYLAHATFGVAPYRAHPNAAYIAESSLKLLQYSYLRRPAVCPSFAVGGKQNRFGYQPGNAASISAAIESALAHEFVHVETPLTWDDVVARLLTPRVFPDTALRPEDFAPSSAQASAS